jgi:iron complex outermembrane receptor protein
LPPCWPSSPPSLNVYDPDYRQPFSFGFTAANETKSTQLGYYLQDQMKFNKVSFVLGARRDEVSNETTFSPKETTRATTYKAGVIAELLPGVSPFLSYSESFEPILGSDVNGNPFDPQDGRQYEGGIKWQPNPNSLITASYFDIEENNLLTQDPNDIQHYIQGGKIGSKGYELEAIVNFAGGFGVTANYSHTKAEVLETTSLHVKGDRLEDLPEDLASLWVSKTFDVNEDLAWRIGGGVRYVGDKIDYYQLQLTPSVTLVDAVAQVSWRTWNFALNVNNVADKEYYASCGAYAYPDGTCNPGQTRTIVGSITKKF